jgi:hypothetical protein
LDPKQIVNIKVLQFSLAYNEDYVISQSRYHISGGGKVFHHKMKKQQGRNLLPQQVSSFFEFDELGGLPFSGKHNKQRQTHQTTSNPIPSLNK